MRGPSQKLQQQISDQIASSDKLCGAARVSISQTATLIAITREVIQKSRAQLSHDQDNVRIWPRRCVSNGR